MTVSPEQQHGVPPEEDMSPAQADEQLDTDPDEVPNAPNRDPGATGAGNDPAAAQPDAADLLDRPNRDPRGADALDPGVGTEPDTESGTESYERPAEQSNWRRGDR